MGYAAERPHESADAYRAMQSALGVPRWLQNFKEDNCRNLFSAINRVRDGQGDANIIVVGDSRDAGAELDTKRNLSPSNQLAKLLTTNGLSARSAGIFGAAGLSDAVWAGGYDTRLTRGSGWASTSLAIGGAYWRNTANANPLTFVPGVTFDNIVIKFIKASTGNISGFTVDIGGGVLATVDNFASGVGAFGQVIIPCTRGANTINIIKAASSFVGICGIDVFDRQAPAVNFCNFAISGSRWSTFANSASTNPHDPWNAYRVLANPTPDAFVFQLGANGWLNYANPDASPEAEFAYAVAALTRLKSAGANQNVDIIIETPPSTNEASVSAEIQRLYDGNAWKLAQLFDAPVIDSRTKLGPWTDNQGEYYDSNHFKRLRSMKKASLSATALRVAVGG